MRLKGKIAVVTGGAQGIGAAITRKFADEGATVIIGDINQNVALATTMAMQKEFGRVVYFSQVNVTDPKSIATFVEGTLVLFKRIDILVNNAGIMRDATLLNMTVENFDAVINVNLRGTFLMTREVAKHMVAQGSGGVILNASSVVANGNFGQTPYAASKAGVEAMTVTWARELAKYQVRVNAIAPGFTETPMTALLPPKAKDRVLAATPLARFATPEEIADAYTFLASDEAKFITGQIVKVDGGFIN